MNYSQIMSPPVPLCLEKWGVMTPQLLWERRPCMLIVLYCTVLYCTVLYCTVLHMITLYCIVHVLYYDYIVSYRCRAVSYCIVL